MNRTLKARALATARAIITITSKRDDNLRTISDNEFDVDFERNIK